MPRLNPCQRWVNWTTGERIGMPIPNWYDKFWGWYLRKRCMRWAKKQRPEFSKRMSIRETNTLNQFMAHYYALEDPWHPSNHPPRRDQQS